MITKIKKIMGKRIYCFHRNFRKLFMEVRRWFHMAAVMLLVSTRQTCIGNYIEAKTAF